MCPSSLGRYGTNPRKRYVSIPQRRIRGPRDLARLSARSREAFANAAQVVTDARRHGTSIGDEVERKRAQGVRISRETVRRYFGQDLERQRGRLVPKQSDRSYHGDMLVLSTDGVIARPLRGSNVRRLVAEHANAVRGYLNGDDPDGEGLQRFAGRRVGGVVLQADPAGIDLLALSGEYEFLDLYADVAG
jgi:hypothetical protein